MALIHIHRTHSLGLAGARQVAESWSEQAQSKLEMACAFAQGEDSDELQFTRPGVKGTLRVCADHFELNAELGMLLSAFKGPIEEAITRNLDELLAEGSGSDSSGAQKPA